MTRPTTLTPLDAPRFPLRRRLLLGLAAAALAGCAPTGMVLHDHPLVGHIYDVRAGRMLDREAALRQMREADVVLLGETHDNPAHHKLQLAILRALAEGRRPVLAMEQFDSEHQGAIDAVLGAADTSAETVADAGKLARKGWNWPLYQPLVDEAVQRGLPVAAINLARDDARKVAREGFEALPEGLARSVVGEVWNAQRNARLEALITVGHCNHVSPEVLKMIVQAQRGRDAVMAGAIAPHAGQGVVAILGRGHARADLAVPIYLAAMEPKRRVLSVGLLEVDEGADAARAYPELAEGAYDLAWFTPRFVRPDPCAAMSAAGMSRAMSK